MGEINYMDTVLVIMQKDIKTGFLEKELASLTIPENENLIINLFAIEDIKTKKLKMCLRLSTERDVEDWEYSAIFDYYDIDIFKEYAENITEEENYYNPAWEIIFDYTDDINELEKKIIKILSIHKNELNDVYKIIKDKESEYK